MHSPRADQRSATAGGYAPTASGSCPTGQTPVPIGGRASSLVGGYITSRSVATPSPGAWRGRLAAWLRRLGVGSGAAAGQWTNRDGRNIKSGAVIRRVAGLRLRDGGSKLRAGGCQSQGGQADHKSRWLDQSGRLNRSRWAIELITTVGGAIFAAIVLIAHVRGTDVGVVGRELET